jgi:proteasome lid subunit RPN8/RPN11
MSSSRRAERWSAPAAVARVIREQARAERPRECCGFLLGSARAIRFALPMPNVAPAPATRYRIDDQAHLEVRRWLRQVRPPLAIVGVYHSHPEGDAVPSATDVGEAYYPDWLYVIAGVRRGVVRVRGYRIADAVVAEVRIDWRGGGLR